MTMLVLHYYKELPHGIECEGGQELEADIAQPVRAN